MRQQHGGHCRQAQDTAPIRGSSSLPLLSDLLLVWFVCAALTDRYTYPEGVGEGQSPQTIGDQHPDYGRNVAVWHRRCDTADTYRDSDRRRVSVFAMLGAQAK